MRGKTTLSGSGLQRESQRYRQFTRRALVLAAGEALMLGTLAARLFQLQIVDSDRYVVLSDENRINLRLLTPPRGRILDRFGIPLADNRQDYHLVITAEQAGNIPATLDALAALIEIEEADRARVMREVRRKHSFVPVVVRDNLSWDEMARVEVAVPELPGISVEQGLTRNYPFRETAAHVIGYVAAVSEDEQTGDPLLELPDFRIGKAGIEKAQDGTLRGTAGTRQVEINAVGRVVRELARIDGDPGQDVVIGLDAAMQEFVTRRCANEPSVSSVLLDAISGEVLALVSSPAFDPALFTDGLKPAVWRQLSSDSRHPLANKAIAGIYPPGSTFKPVAALAALTAGVLTPETAITCTGQLALGNAVFHCWRKGGHGTLRLRDAIKKSCDVFFYETARRLGIDRLAAMANRLGYGAPLGIDIPGEKGGLIPTQAWKLDTTGAAWQAGETLIAGIGQGSVLATPLQIATMVARLVSGRAVVPHFLRSAGIMTEEGGAAQPDFPEIGVDLDARALVLDGMNAVVNEPGGTAYAARIAEPEFAMGGKSGTSQVRRISQYERDHGLRKIDEIPWKDRDHALFVAFAPVSTPRYVCATVVEHAGFGSEVAAPICRDVLREVQLRDPARRVPAKNTVARSLSPTVPPLDALTTDRG
ncbi:MAG: penicillin-binding protein 2 [Alphaproteobacteria bacterium]|nr:penicillin-binding protein 2 [Alphaproteobacteria bacterium]